MSPMIRTSPLLLMFLLSLPACGAGSSASSARTTVVPTTYVTPDDAGTASARFDEANALLSRGHYRQAAGAFDRLVAFEPNGRFASPALFNAGLSYERAEDRVTAADRYRTLVRKFPEGEEAKPALLRLTRVLSYLEQWPELLQAANMLLARGDLSPMERIEALGARALGLVEQNRTDEASLAISKARTIVEQERIDQTSKMPVGAAQVFFALGEVRRLKGERIKFVPVPPDFPDVLEQRCQSLLDAQDAYATAMRAYDAHWAAMSGYRVGQLYQQLHRDIMRVPSPSTAKTQKQKELFAGAMQLRYRVLLEKGLKMMDRTVGMAKRTGERSVWVNRAEEARRDLEGALEQVQQALDRLPYTEADLQRALDGLASPP